MTEGMLWGGRFGAGPTDEMLALSSSVEVDLALLPIDLQVTKAHCRSLVSAGVLEPSHLGSIDAACDDILKEWSSGSLQIGSSDEDVHSMVERRLIEALGDVGRSIHAGRSRNDLVVTDLRLWCRSAAADIAEELGVCIRTLCDVAEDHVEHLMPGYTHLQRAQPITLGYHLAAHGFALLRDRGRLLSAAGSADVSALGAGAIAGTTLPLDPEVAAAELGFHRVFDNAMDAVADRDFAADLIYACALLGIHLSRLGEEVVLWTSSEFGFATLDDAWSTGSSMMPQKRNPDLAELTRGRAGTSVGDLAGFLALLKGLPFAYNRDLQEDKAIVFRVVATASRSLRAATRSISALRFDPARMAAAASVGGMWATDVAEALVTRGVPFREAHAAAGRLVAALEEAGTDLAEAPQELLRGVHPRLGAGDRALADPRRSVEARSGPGGPAPARVRDQIASLRAAVAVV